VEQLGRKGATRKFSIQTLQKMTLIVTFWEPVTTVCNYQELLQAIGYFVQPCFLIVVTVHCKDTRIVVNVNTNRAFSGRIYALGRSETCNVDVINSDSFRLDLTMSGQDCNTQSAVRRFLKIFCVLKLWLNECVSEWCLYQHCGGATPQRRHDQD